MNTHTYPVGDAECVLGIEESGAEERVLHNCVHEINDGSVQPLAFGGDVQYRVIAKPLVTYNFFVLFRGQGQGKLLCE